MSMKHEHSNVQTYNILTTFLIVCLSLTYTHIHIHSMRTNAKRKNNFFLYFLFTKDINYNFLLNALLKVLALIQMHTHTMGAIMCVNLLYDSLGFSSIMFNGIFLYIICCCHYTLNVCKNGNFYLLHIKSSLARSVVCVCVYV